MLEQLRNRVCECNIELKREGIVIYTWGNVSGISDDRRYIVIKPSGIEYESLKPQDMVVVEVGTGKVVEGDYRPSSDTPTHLALYKAFPKLGGIVHTHSEEAVAWAQAGRDIPVYGTTHADYFHGDIPCARGLSDEEIRENYEENTGRIIIETVSKSKADYMDIPGILCRNHGPFTWGRKPEEAVHNAFVIEKIAKMARLTEIINSGVSSMPQELIDKHYSRKHGAYAYYGQL